MTDFQVSIYIRTIKNYIDLYWPSMLIFIAILGFISKSLYQYPVGLMATFGLYQFIRQPKMIIEDKNLKLFSQIFLSIWLAMVIATFDAYQFERALKTTSAYSRFFLAGIFIIPALSSDKRRIDWLVTGVALLVSFWVIDATLQFFIGVDLFGYTSIPGHMTGMFYPELQLPHICSVLSTFVFLFISYKANSSCRFLLIVPLFFIVFLAGRRATWLMLALSSIGFLFYLYLYNTNRSQLTKTLLKIILTIVLMFATTAVVYDPIRTRIINTMGLFSTSYETIDKATAFRLPIWETSIDILKANKLNGIGPRGFRYAYPEYRNKDNRWRSQTHPHLLMLEVLVETGIIGFLCYLIFLYLICKGFITNKHKQELFPFIMPVLVAIFPLNAHMAFFGSVWSSMIWLLIYIYISKIRSLTITVS